MTAVTGANIRSGEAYWELSGPAPINRTVTCRGCRKPVYKGEEVMVRDGRKLRFHYHAGCFSGDADPRTQSGSSYETRGGYHRKTAPNVSSLEGPRACRDADGRVLGREVFKAAPPQERRRREMELGSARRLAGLRPAARDAPRRPPGAAAAARQGD